MCGESCIARIEFKAPRFSGFMKGEKGGIEGERKRLGGGLTFPQGLAMSSDITLLRELGPS